MELKYSNADLIKDMRKNYFTKILISNILATPLSIAVALVVANWQLMPQLTIIDIIVGIIPLIFYVFICTILFPIPLYYIFFILLEILQKVIRNNHFFTLTTVIISSIICSFSLQTIVGLWQLHLHAETTVIAFISSVIINSYFIYVKKIDCNIIKLKAFYYSQLIISLLLFIFSFRSFEQGFNSTPLFQRGTYYQNIRIPLLATGSNTRLGLSPSSRQDPQLDLKTFTQETGIPSNDVASVSRTGYYNTGMCIQAKLNENKLHSYKESFPAHQLEEIKSGTCFRISDIELYAPRDFQGQLISLKNNKLWGKQKFILIDPHSNMVSLFIL